MYSSQFSMPSFQATTISAGPDPRALATNFVKLKQGAEKWLARGQVEASLYHTAEREQRVSINYFSH